jgi:GLPGLI family protein
MTYLHLLKIDQMNIFSMKMLFCIMPFSIFSDRGFGQFKDGYNKINYTLEYIADSTNPAKKRKEAFVLLFSDTMSYSASKNLISFNEAIKNTFEKMEKGEPVISPFPTNTKRSVLMMGLYNHYVQGTSTMIAHLFPNTYALKYPSLSWQLVGDTATVAGIFCKSATTSFGGRDYTAWYAPDIPIPDGPFLFKGLPGLIIKVYDRQYHYVFSYEGPCVDCNYQIPAIPKGIEWISRRDLIRLNSYEGKKAQMIESGILDAKWEGVSREELMKRAENNLRSFNNPLELNAN